MAHVCGPAQGKPESANTVVVVVEATPDPHVSFLHMTGTDLCCNREKLPRNPAKRKRRIADASGATQFNAEPRPSEIPWGTRAFANGSTDPFPFNQAVRRLLFNVSRSPNAGGALRAGVKSAMGIYFSANTTTPYRSEVLRHLLNAKSVAGGKNGLSFTSPAWTATMSYLVKNAVDLNVRLELPHRLTVPLTVACYAGVVENMFYVTVREIHEFAVRADGPGWPSAFACKPSATKSGTAALDLANQIGLLQLVPDRRKHMETMLGPTSKFRGLTSTMQLCYSKDRQTGNNCVACPLTHDQKSSVCDAAYDDTPAAVWARQASCAGELSVKTLTDTVLPCVRPFGTAKRLKYRQRQDVANVIKVVSEAIRY